MRSGSWPTRRFFFAAAKYAQQAGVPVTGNSSDGPEWGEQPYTNMFDAFRGSENPATPVNSIYGNFLKSHGGTIIGTYGYGVSPLSADEANGAAQSFQRAGGKVGVLDTTVPFGGVDFTSEALIAKQKHVNAHPSDDGRRLELRSRDGARAGGREAQGSSVVGRATSRHVIHSPAWPSLQGAYFLSLARPFSLPNAGTEQMAAALTKYAALHQERVPQLRPGLVVARLRPHDQGVATCGTESDPRWRHQGATQHQVLQRQRIAADQHQLLDSLRSRPPPVCLGPAGPEIRLRADLVKACLWHGLPRHEHPDELVGAPNY